MSVAKVEFEKWEDGADVITPEVAYITGFNRALDILQTQFLTRNKNYGNDTEISREKQHV